METGKRKSTERQHKQDYCDVFSSWCECHKKRNVYSYQEVPQIILFTISSILNDIEWDKINTGNITNTHPTLTLYDMGFSNPILEFLFCCFFKRQIKFFLLFTKNLVLFFCCICRLLHYNRWWFYFYFSLFMFGHYLGFFRI